MYVNALRAVGVPARLAGIVISHRLYIISWAAFEETSSQFILIVVGVFLPFEIILLLCAVSFFLSPTRHSCVERQYLTW
jgi:hypothetical protein